MHSLLKNTCFALVYCLIYRSAATADIKLIFTTCAGLLTNTCVPLQHCIPVKPLQLPLCDKEHNFFTPLQGTLFCQYHYHTLIAYMDHTTPLRSTKKQILSVIIDNEVILTISSKNEKSSKRETFMFYDKQVSLTHNLTEVSLSP